MTLLLRIVSTLARLLGRPQQITPAELDYYFGPPGGRLTKNNGATQ